MNLFYWSVSVSSRIEGDVVKVVDGLLLLQPTGRINENLVQHPNNNISIAKGVGRLD